MEREKDKFKKIKIKQEIEDEEEAFVETGLYFHEFEETHSRPYRESFSSNLLEDQAKLSDDLSLEAGCLHKSNKYTTSKGVNSNEVAADQKCKSENSTERRENNHRYLINEKLVDVKLETCEEECSSNKLPKNISNDYILPTLPSKMAVCETVPAYDCNNSFPLTFDTNSKLFFCEICVKPFRKKAYLKEHMISHSNEKPFPCIICDKTFKTKNNLTSHMKSHSDEKPHECDICDKSFKRKCDLRRHVFSHSGEKLFLCEICHRSFKRKTHLKDHIIAHSGEKPFVCKICEKSYKQKRSLKSHMLSHANEIV